MVCQTVEVKNVDNFFVGLSAVFFEAGKKAGVRSLRWTVQKLLTEREDELSVGRNMEWVCFLWSYWQASDHLHFLEAEQATERKLGPRQEKWCKT